MAKTVHIHGFEIVYENEPAFWQTYQEIFKENEYNFECSEPQPLILDCGSNIGISVLYFKSKFPQARIIAFEPDPQNYELLQRNIAGNDLDSVTAINVALADYTGYGTLYRERLDDEDGPDTRGYSIVQNWGDRGHSTRLKVRVERLSAYIQESVHYLKLDVEGAEQAVLRDIERQLGYVERIFVEYHGMSLDSDENDLETIVGLLEHHYFDVEVIGKELEDFLPEEFSEWVKRTNPTLSTLRAVSRRGRS